MLSWKSAIHVLCPLTLTTYKYNELQMSDATKKLSYKAHCKTPIFIILKNNHEFVALECV
jgi:hypothetical protein